MLKNKIILRFDKVNYAKPLVNQNHFFGLCFLEKKKYHSFDPLVTSTEFMKKKKGKLKRFDSR